MTKEQATGILNATLDDLSPYSDDGIIYRAIEALATAGAFTDGAVLSVEECDAIRKAVAAAPGLNLVALNAVAKLDAQAHATPSRPVATEAKAHGSETWDEAQDRLYRERHPEQFRHVAACSKAWAEEIRRGIVFGNNSHAVAAQAMIEALDRAGIFPDEATLAEIRDALATFDEWEKDEGEGPSWAELTEAALRLATAVRKLGIGGGK